MVFIETWGECSEDQKRSIVHHISQRARIVICFTSGSKKNEAVIIPLSSYQAQVEYEVSNC